ncbi:MAG TPA: glycosyltransferase family 4 protein [Ornithinicoccus sp.]|nr:glycosyltransferase family 4 protein [Ornithinicoccus sp.]
MRIALVSDVYLPRLGGIEVQVADLATHLRAAGHEVRVVTATPGPSAEGVARLVPPVPLPAPVNPWAGPALRAELAAADVVHVHLGVVAPFASTAAKIALAARRPTVVTWHSLLSGVPIPYAGRWRRWMQGGVVRTAVSAAAAEQVRTVTRLPSPIDVLPNGISVDDWAALDALPSRLRPGDPVRMVSAIRFARRKRPLQLIRLARRIRRLVPSDQPLELVVAGAGPLWEPVRRRVQAAGADWISLPGRLSRKELARLYQRSHLYLNPGRMESFGIAALEARTAGLAVAGLADTGLTEFIRHGVDGVLAPTDRELADGVAALIVDPGALNAILEHNRSVRPEQSWDNVVRATLAAYDRAIAVRERED